MVIKQQFQGFEELLYSSELPDSGSLTLPLLYQEELDDWDFWQQGYPGVMVTDTAPLRYPYYHTEDDTPDKVDYDRLARVVAGLERAIADLSGLSQRLH